MWQVDVVERIKTLEKHADQAQHVQERDQILSHLERIRYEIPPYRQKIQEIQQTATEQKRKPVFKGSNFGGGA